MSNARSRGFTLVELMVTVVILAILVGIAYPSYRNYTIQTRRSDAQIALTQTTNRLEKYFSLCNSYPTAGATAGLTNPWPGQGAASDCPPDDSTQGLGRPLLSPDGYYTLSIAGATIGGVGTIATAFTVTATPVTGGLQDGNGALRIDSTGVKQWNKPGAGWGAWTRK